MGDTTEYDREQMEQAERLVVDVQDGAAVVRSTDSRQEQTLVYEVLLPRYGRVVVTKYGKPYGVLVPPERSDDGEDG